MIIIMDVYMHLWRYKQDAAKQTLLERRFYL